MNRATLFLFASLILLLNCSVAQGQGCGTTLVRHFSVYNSVSGDGTNISTSVTMQGYASVTPSAGCNMNAATHHVGAENKLNNVDHWSYSASGCPTCYFTVRDDEQIVGVPGVVYPWSWDGVAICSLAGTFFSSGGGGGVASYTPVQHQYPGKPLSAPCWISRFFDVVTNGKVHKAQDVVNSNANNNGGMKPAYGTPVYAAEGGTVVKAEGTNGPAGQAYPACVGRVPAWPANYVKIQGNDGYFTVYVHVTPTVAVGTPVTQGQQIGVTDNSGCQSGAHIHMRRTDPNGTPVNFTIPCVNPLPTINFTDGLVDDDVPDL
jgi:murein DD-endopeptidase MepM/ murein hydrolase activator NlpD